MRKTAQNAPHGAKTAKRIADSGAGCTDAQRVTGDARAVLDAAISEATWQAQIVAYAEAHGWVCWHDRDSRRNDAGLPDLLCIRERIIWIEVKAQRGRVSRVQAWFHALLRDAGQRVYVWRPSDWSQVERVLGCEEQ